VPGGAGLAGRLAVPEIQVEEGSMLRVRLVERDDGDWCAFVEGHEDDAVVGPTDEAALGRLLREQRAWFGVEAIGITSLDIGLSGEPAARFANDERLIGPDSEAPEVRRPGEPSPNLPGT